MGDSQCVSSRYLGPVSLTFLRYGFFVKNYLPSVPATPPPPQDNVTCYLKGVVMGSDKFRVSLNFVSYVSVVRSYL